MTKTIFLLCEMVSGQRQGKNIKAFFLSAFSFLENTLQTSALCIPSILVLNTNVTPISLSAWEQRGLYTTATRYPAGLLQHQGESALQATGAGGRSQLGCLPKEKHVKQLNHMLNCFKKCKASIGVTNASILRSADNSRFAEEGRG